MHNGLVVETGVRVVGAWVAGCGVSSCQLTGCHNSVAKEYAAKRILNLA